MMAAKGMKNVKVLCVDEDGLLTCKGYRLFDETGTLRIVDGKYALLSHFALMRRFFRAEITGLYNLKNGNRLAIAKKGLFLQKEGSSRFEKCFAIRRGSKPLNICVKPEGELFFGEYFQNKEKKAVNIYCSNDDAKTWHVVYSFPEGSINHIHGLFHDPYTNRIWLATGDLENECVIGWTDDGFKTVTEVFRGGQEFRTCQLFFYRDFVVFATDSQYMKNEIKCFDRKTLGIRTLAKIQGSAIKGGQKDDVAFLSSTIEPSEVNKDLFAHIWMTRDGLHWKEVYAARKDGWPFILQFGTFEFPQYRSSITDKLYCSGRALKGCDGKTLCIDIANV